MIHTTIQDVERHIPAEWFARRGMYTLPVKETLEAVHALAARVDTDPAPSKLIPFDRSARVYMLHNAGKVVYVGQSVTLAQRIATHVKDGKQFDSVSWIEVEDSELLIIEAYTINHYNPILNSELFPDADLIAATARRVGAHMY